MPRKRILLAVDGSDASLETVHYVAKIFPAARTAVVLLHVATNIPGIFWHIGEKFHDGTRPSMVCLRRASAGRSTGIGTIVTGRRHLAALESWLLRSVRRQIVNCARGMAVWVAA